LSEEHLEPAAAAIDGVARDGSVRGIGAVERRETALDFIGERHHGVQPDHLDRPGGLVDMDPRMRQRRGVARRRPERRERFLPARERLVDFALDPGQRSYVKIGGIVDGRGTHEGMPGSSAPSGRWPQRARGSPLPSRRAARP
jgi:hypothetical protein